MLSGMPVLVTDYTSKRVCDYLDTGRYQKVLILFHHGLGDSVMFWSTCMKALKKQYPGIDFTFATHLGQEAIFGKADEDPSHYDIAFKLHYPCSEWGSFDETKSEKCARVELGISLPIKEDYGLPKEFSSPLVGVHFNSTCCSGFNVSRDFGRKLWDQILENGFIPIDTHMRHATDNASKSVIHDYEQCRRVDNVPASLDKLIGLISVCRGFAGVPSGNMPCALSVMSPDHVLYLSSEFPMNRLVRLPCFEMNIKKPYDPGIVQAWLDRLRG